MALETGTFISDLVITNPTASDPVSEGDDHTRLIKKTVKNSFPNITGAVTLTHTEINGLSATANAYPDTQIAAEVAARNTAISTADTSVRSDFATADAAIQSQVTTLSSQINSAGSTGAPVGTLYFNASNGTDPATLLGFGTWQRIGEGKVLLGFGSNTDSDGTFKDFNTAGATGGTYNQASGTDNTDGTPFLVVYIWKRTA